MGARVRPSPEGFYRVVATSVMGFSDCIPQVLRVLSLLTAGSISLGPGPPMFLTTSSGVDIPYRMNKIHAVVLWKLISQQPDPMVPPKERPPSEPPPSSFMGDVKQVRKYIQYYLDTNYDCTITVIIAEDRMRTSDDFVDQRHDSDKDNLGVRPEDYCCDNANDNCSHHNTDRMNNIAVATIDITFDRMYNNNKSSELSAAHVTNIIWISSSVCTYEPSMNDFKSFALPSDMLKN